MTVTPITRAIPPDIDAITARAEAAPGGTWEAFTERLWIPWTAPGDDDCDPGDWACSGRWITIEEGGWHRGSEDPPAALWEFLAAARRDVLALGAEVRRLRADRAQLDGTARKNAA